MRQLAIGYGKAPADAGAWSWNLPYFSGDRFHDRPAPQRRETG